MHKIDSHFIFFLLKSVFHMPKLLYFLFTLSSFNFYEQLQSFDSALLNASEKVRNASRSVTEVLLKRIMGSILSDICYSEALEFEIGYFGPNGVPVDDIKNQKTWFKWASTYQRELLVSAADSNNKKRLLASNGDTSGTWLTHVLCRLEFT